MSDKESSASGASPSVAAGDSPQGASALLSAAGPITGVWVDEMTTYPVGHTDLNDAAYDAIDKAEQLRRTAQPTCPACKGTNCGATDGLSHSPECRAEHEATVNPCGMYDAQPTPKVLTRAAKILDDYKDKSDAFVVVKLAVAAGELERRLIAKDAELAAVEGQLAGVVEQIGGMARSASFKINNDWNQQFKDGYRSGIAELMHQIRAITPKEPDPVAQDAERLDWIESYLINGGELGLWFYTNYFRIEDDANKTIAKEINLRAAIDAARNVGVRETYEL